MFYVQIVVGVGVPIALVISYFLLVGYTRLLQKATEKYAQATERLFELNKQSLDLSRDSFNQSRKAFLVNLVNETINYGITMRISGQAPNWVASYVGAVYKAIRDVDVGLAKDFEKAWRSWSEGEWSVIKQMRPQILKAFEEMR